MAQDRLAAAAEKGAFEAFAVSEREFLITGRCYGMQSHMMFGSGARKEITDDS